MSSKFIFIVIYRGGLMGFRDADIRFGGSEKSCLLSCNYFFAFWIGWRLLWLCT